MGMLATLQRLREKYGRQMNDDECVALCNDAAWEHRAEGYGVSRKERGTRGRRYDGQECCHDVIMLRDGTYWDVLDGAGLGDPPGYSVPKWGVNGNGQPAGTITDPLRGWIAPIVPQGGVVIPEPPGPTPEPPSGELERRVAALEAWARGLAYRG